MIVLNDTNKRVTWRLDRQVHAKISRIAKTADLSLEEVANLILQDVDWETVKPAISKFRADKKATEQKKKQATEAVSKLDPDLLNKLADLSPDDLAKMLQ